MGSPPVAIGGGGALGGAPGPGGTAPGMGPPDGGSPSWSCGVAKNGYGGAARIVRANGDLSQNGTNGVVGTPRWFAPPFACAYRRLRRKRLRLRAIRDSCRHPQEECSSPAKFRVPSARRESNAIDASAHECGGHDGSDEGDGGDEPWDTSTGCIVPGARGGV